jgi:glycosyltransferase involved in cell wall biosynthesis
MSAKRIRILFDAHALLGQKTGVGYYTSSLISELAAEHPSDIELIGYYHNFLYRKKTPDLPQAPNIRYRQVAFMPGQIVNLLRRFHILLPVELLTLTKADFILYPNYLGLASIFRTPSASVIHDLTFVDLPAYVARKNLSDLQHFIPHQIKRSKFIITVSEFGKKRIHEVFQVPTKNILVTPIPPALPQFTKVEDAKAVLKRLGIKGKFILTLGTVEPRKNLITMLDAYLKLPEDIQNEYAFVSAGKIGWNCDAEMTKLSELQAAGKNIIRVGYVSDDERSALYRNAVLFTWASHYEGFGMPILEAMSFGIPCAISDIPVFREVAGDSALYFDQKRAGAIAKTWLQILTNTAVHSRLAMSGIKRAESYKWSDVAASLYDRIVRALEKQS